MEEISSKDGNFVGGNIYKNIKVDKRVTEDLAHCLYCKVYDEEYSSYSDYKLTLNCIKGNDIKQCPSCKRIYLLNDPTK